MDARPSGRIRKVMSELAGHPKIIITIVSGRDIKSLLELFGGFDTSQVNWSGAHGMQMRFCGSDSTLFEKAPPEIISVKNEINDIIGPYPCFNLEDKKIAFALHYRKCPQKFLFVLDRAEEILNRHMTGNNLDVLKMKKVIEVKPAGVSKGDTVGAVLAKYGCQDGSINICIGDDLTDEYLFMANPEGINIKVGKHKGLHTAAGYFLKGVSDVYWFLTLLRSKIIS